MTKTLSERLVDAKGVIGPELALEHIEAYSGQDLQYDELAGAYKQLLKKYDGEKALAAVDKL